MRPKRPSPALVIAWIALASSLGGTGYAATQIGSGQIRNRSIQGLDIKNDTISTSKIKDSAVTSQEIRNATIQRADLAADALPNPGLGAPVAVQGQTATLGPGQISGATATCPPGTTLTGGGYASVGADSEVFTNTSYGGATTWYVNLDNFDSSLTATVTAQAMCAAVAPGAVATARKVDARAARLAAEAIAVRRAAHAGG
jgi:hypothetical protein